MHQKTPNEPVSLQTLRDLGVLYWRVEGGAESPKLARIRKERGYNNHDFVDLHPDRLPEYETKIKRFFEEHLHDDEEIRFVLKGQGFFDLRDDQERWIRIWVKQGDMIVLPAGMYHRFTLDATNYIHAMRLFQDEPKWTAHNRGAETDTKVSRSTFLGKRKIALEELVLISLFTARNVLCNVSLIMLCIYVIRLLRASMDMRSLSLTARPLWRTIRTCAR
jgi:1,2-dihydroxy-3-keto-5-methylthiopentene dioxygenase